MVMAVTYSYREIEKAYNILKEVVIRENKLHMMDMTIMGNHLETIEYDILPLLETIVYYDPTP
jgi:hypothetical protein